MSGLYKKMKISCLLLLVALALLQTYSNGEAPTKPKVVSVVLLGSTGNLAEKYLWQGLYNIYTNGLASGATLRIYPCATKPFEKGNPVLQRVLSNNITWSSPESKRSFLANVGSYTQLRESAHWEGLKKQITSDTAEEEEIGRLVYMSVPPKVFGSISKEVKEQIKPSDGSTWLRVIVEKPFGVDLESARHLAQQMYENLESKEILLVDHYMGKQGLDGIRKLRFHDQTVDAKLSHRSVSHVDFAMLETEDCLGRTSFYDDVGVIRDTVQNHLMMMYALLTMELGGAAVDEATARQEAFGVLSVAGVQSVNYAGQYADYNQHINQDRVKWGEEETEEISTTPTFVHVSLASQIEQWGGPPLNFLSGKALDKRRAFTRVTFKDGSILLFNIQGVTNDVDGAAIYASFGLDSCPPQWKEEETALPGTLCVPEVKAPTAYQVLLHSALDGNLENFVRLPEVLESWRVWTPLLENMESVELKTYQHGMDVDAELSKSKMQEKEEL